MHARLGTPNRKTFFISILSASILILSSPGFGASLVQAQEGTPPPRKLEAVTVLPEAPQQVGRYYRFRTLSLSNGTLVAEHTINGPSVPPAGFDAERQAVALPMPNGVTANVIPGVMAGAIAPNGGPLYSLGCSPTAVTDILKTDEKSNLQNIYPGVMPPDGSFGTFIDHKGVSYTIHPLTATRLTLEHLWDFYQSTAPDPGPGGPDLSVDQVGSLMRSSVFDLGDYDHDGIPDHNNDGDTKFFANAEISPDILDSGNATSVMLPRPFTSDQAAAENLPDGTYGIELFYKARGYAVSEAYNQPTDNVVAGGFSFNQFKAEIDGGRPVMIHLGGQSNSPGHSVVGVAYDAASSLVYIHDGWDTNTHTMPWGGSYADMPMFMVSVIHPVPPAHAGDYTISGYVGTPNATVTYSGGSAMTDNDGYYSISVPPGWSGRLTPSKPGYTFQPPYKEYSNLPDFQTKQSYTATLIQGANLLVDPGFELGRANPYWTGTSTTFGTPLCDAACGPGARTGSVWAWFGGISSNETATLSQTLTIPHGATASLDFYLWLGEAGTGSDKNDVFTVKVDGTTLFTANATQLNAYATYVPVRVDVTAYANGAPHTITFGSATTGQVVSFHLDDVSLVVAPLGHPGAFNKISPPDATLSQSTNPTLSWESSDGAASYEYCYDATNDNACSPWTNNGASTSKALSGLSPNTTYYWHARAVNLSGTTYSNASSTAFWSFTTVANLPSAFNKSLPANGAINQSTSPTLSWASSSGADYYEYCYDATNDNTCSPWTSNSLSTSKVLSGLSPNTLYYWHVRAVNAGGTTYSNASTTAFWSFTTMAGPPSAFTKSSPSNGATNQLASLNLSWGSSSGATSYEYCYDATNDYVCSPWIATGMGTSANISGLTPGATYYWQVRANNGTDTTYANGSSTAYWSFSISTDFLWSGTTNQSHPMSFHVNSTGASWNTFKLKAAFVATSCYNTSGTLEITVSGPGNIANNQFTVSGSSFSASGQFTSSTAATGTYSFTNYPIVISFPYACTYYFTQSGTWIAGGQLPVSPPDPFSKTSPTNGATNQSTSPTLSWASSSGATSYEYCYDTTNDNACSNWTSNGSSTSKTLNGLSQGVTYYWHVRAINSGGTTYSNGSTTAFWNFTTTTSLNCYTLTRAHTGNGADPVAIPTNSTGCSTGNYHAGELITLTASPAAGSQVGNWSGTGNDASTSLTNTVTMPAQSWGVAVNYIPVYYQLTVYKAGTGSGTVTSSPAGINCGSDCSESYSKGTSVVLSASSASGSIFAGWTGGGCSGTGTCTVTMTGAITVTASFTQGQSQTFADVPPSHMFWKEIEAFYQAGITTGCSQSPKMYCPNAKVTRAEMAVFLERAMGNFAPNPNPTGMFADVPGTFWASKFIDEFYNDGITTGCATNPKRYCPDNNVTRQEMAVFIERALGNFNPNPSPTGMFADVPYPGIQPTFPAFIYQFYNDGITTGCDVNPLRFCPLNNVTRQEMAVFIVRAFHIPLP